MGDLLCRLIYFQYTDAILERNMDSCLQVHNDKISGNSTFGHFGSEQQNSGIGCQLSGIRSVASPSGKY